MSSVKSNKLIHWWETIYQWRFYILIICILPTLSLPGFFDADTNRRIIWPISRTLILFGCANVIMGMKRGRLLVFLLGLVSTGSGWLTSSEIDPSTAALIGLTLFGLFIAIVTWECLRQIHLTDEVDLHIIVGSMAGFMLIGIIGGVLYTVMHVAYPHSFSNVPAGLPGVSELVYLSFITVLTVGYGDIVPITEASRFLSILLGLIGQFYIVVLMAILVGKYLFKIRIE